MVEHVAKRATFTRVLKNRDFLFLWMGQLFSQLADRIFIYVLLILAYNLTQSNLGVSFPMLSFGIPAVLFSWMAGVYADRFNRRKILIISNLLRGFLILLIFVPFVYDSLFLVFFLSFAIYTVSQFFMPAETATIPDIVDKPNLIIANSLFMVTWMGSSVVGFGIGAPLTNLFQESGTFIFAAGLYFLAGLFVFLIKSKMPKHKSTANPKPIRQEIMVGVEFIRRNMIIRYTLLKMFMATSVIAILSVLAVSFAKNILHIGEKNFGYLIVMAGVGMLVGILFIGRFNHLFRKGTIVISGFIVTGLTLALFATVNNVIWAFIFSFILGFGNALITATLQTIMQEKIPNIIRGRIFGIQNMLINSAFTFPVVLCGYLADIIGLRVIIYVVGVIVSITGLISMLDPKFKNI